MLENDFYTVWTGSISKRWRTLGKDMAKIAWRQRHNELVNVTEEVCKDACEKMVMEPDVKFAPAIGSIVNRIIRENDPKAKNPFNENEDVKPADPAYANRMFAAACVMADANDVRRLETIDMIPGICKQHNVPLDESTREQYNLLKLRIQARMKVEAPIRKAEAAQAKKLTKAEWIARAKRRRAGNTLGNALGRALQ